MALGGEDRKYTPTAPKPAPASATTSGMGTTNDNTRWVHQGGGLVPAANVDDGSWLGATPQAIALHPGWSPTQGYSQEQYQAWLDNSRQDPAFQALEKAYGAKYVAYDWFASRTNLDPNAFQQQLNMKFAGWQNLNLGGPGNGSSGPTKAQQIDGAMAQIRNQAGVLGRPMDEGSIRALAGTVVAQNWNGAQLTDYLTNDPTKITEPGMFQNTVEQIKQMGRAQLMTVSDATATEWAKKITSGEMDTQTVGTVFAKQAAAEFGWAADAIATGGTMRDLLMPARDSLANELELNPNTIDFMDPRWRNMAQTTGPDGIKRAATMTEVVKNARSDPQWQNTANAARAAANVATMLRQTFEGG